MLIHLHNHSEYSLQDALPKSSELAEAALKANMPSIALTDHGHIAGGLEFYLECKKRGIKPIIGVEAYLVEDALIKSAETEDRKHLTLLAKDYEGYRNLVKLMSWAGTEGFYRVPRVDFSSLKKYSDGLICMSACSYQCALLDGEGVISRKRLAFFKALFGRRFFLEIMPHDLDKQREINAAMYEISNKAFKTVSTCDIHYIDPEDSKVHDTLMQIQGRDPYSCDSFWFHDDESVANMFEKYHPFLPEKFYREAMENTLLIDGLIEEYEIPLRKFEYPEFDLPNGEEDSGSYLIDLARNGLDSIAQSDDEVVEKLVKYEDQLQLELDLIIKLGYQDYFLICWDIVSWARRNGILMAARGSANASLVAYALGMTFTDPIKHELIFERFMNEVRSSFDPPDIDLDVQSSKRSVILDYIREKYKNVVTIGSHGRMWAASALKDVCKVFDVEFDEINKIIANRMHGIGLEEALDQVEGLRDWVEKTPKNTEIFNTASRIQGLARHRSQHKAGLVITREEPSNSIPLVRISGDTCTQWKDEMITERGLLKVDILGLSTLDILSDIKQLVGIGFSRIPLDDERVFDLVQSGKNMGIFQLEKGYIAKFAKQMGIDTFSDIVALSTIVRPHPLRSGATDSFIARKVGKERFSFSHGLVRESLEDVYGLPIYQESVMKVFNRVGNISLADTEVIRDAIKHFRSEVILSFRNKFVEGSINNGLEENDALDLWDLVKTASGYTFNKAHATAYSLYSYWLGWMKIHYPKEFYLCALRYEKDSGISRMVREAKKNNVEVRDVDLNKSGLTYEMNDGIIYKGFIGIKGIGAKAALEIVKKRPDGGYVNLFHVANLTERRVVNRRVIKTLAGLGKKPEIKTKNFDGYDYEQIMECNKCELCNHRKNVVKMSANGNNRGGILFVGEAPGAKEDAKGIPFVGGAGQVFWEKYLRPLGFMRKDVAVTNVVKCRPPKNETPTDEQVERCLGWLELEIASLRPKLIVVMGATALRALTEEKSVTAFNGEEVDVTTPSGKQIDHGFALFHPAYLMRSGFDQSEAVAKLKGLIERVFG